MKKGLIFIGDERTGKTIASGQVIEKSGKPSTIICGMPKVKKENFEKHCFIEPNSIIVFNDVNKKVDKDLVLFLIDKGHLVIIELNDKTILEHLQQDADFMSMFDVLQFPLIHNFVTC